MWTTKHYRNIVCKECGVQSRTQAWMCACELLWHMCPVHRVDPQTHTSKRTAKSSSIPNTPIELLPSDRCLPVLKMRRLSTRHANPHPAASKGLLIKQPVVCTEPAPVCHYRLSVEACPKLAARHAIASPHLFMQSAHGRTGILDVPPGALTSTTQGVCVSAVGGYSATNASPSVQLKELSRRVS